MTSDSQIAVMKRAQWQGSLNVQHFVEQAESAHGSQRLRNTIETDIVRRFTRGKRILDVGIGTGRVSLPLVQDGVQLTGIDTSPAMIERCRNDERATAVRLVPGELEHLPFARESFDTVLSVDTFAHFPDWVANLDELLRVTRIGGRIIIDVGSRDHIDAVAQRRRYPPDQVRAAELSNPNAYILRLSSADLDAYACERNISLVALVPYGAIFGTMVPNYWIGDSYACRSGGIDRLVSWIGTDVLLFAFAEFIERRIVQQLPPSITGRMFAVFEREPSVAAWREPLEKTIAARDERGPEAWHTEFAAHVQHEPNRTFAVAFLLAARPAALAVVARSVLPEALLRELERTERAAHIDDVCASVIGALRSTADVLSFHGVDLSAPIERSMKRELRDRFESQA